MKAIIFYSKELIDITAEELDHLKQNSRLSNFKKNVTGFLYKRSGCFMEYMEGDEDTIDELIGYVRGDERHQVLCQIEQKELSNRRFDYWYVKFVSEPQEFRIHLEDILKDHLEFRHDHPALVEKWDKIIWRSVDSLSYFYKGSRDALSFQ